MPKNNVENKLEYVGRKLTNLVELEAAFKEVENLNGHVKSSLKGLKIDYLYEGIENCNLSSDEKKLYFNKYLELLKIKYNIK